MSFQPGTPWEETKRDLDEESDTESVNGMCGQAVKIQEEPVWTDWQEINTHPTTCLFCPFTTTKVTVPAIVDSSRHTHVISSFPLDLTSEIHHFDANSKLGRCLMLGSIIYFLSLRFPEACLATCKFTTTSTLRTSLVILPSTKKSKL